MIWKRTAMIWNPSTGERLKTLVFSPSRGVEVTAFCETLRNVANLA
jgi:hypothetical protein